MKIVLLFLLFACCQGLFIDQLRTISKWNVQTHIDQIKTHIINAIKDNPKVSTTSIVIKARRDTFDEVVRYFRQEGLTVITDPLYDKVTFEWDFDGHTLLKEVRSTYADSSLYHFNQVKAGLLGQSKAGKTTYDYVVIEDCNTIMKTRSLLIDEGFKAHTDCYFFVTWTTISWT